ncbi:MAG: toxin [Sulfuricurvum sp.]
MSKLKTKIIRYCLEKNEKLKNERRVSFEQVLLAIEEGDLLDDLRHPNSQKYPCQDIFIILIRIKNYIYIVPYIETEDEIFLKTIIPSRKLNKVYNKGATNDKA